jgi:hypothetical protein
MVSAVIQRPDEDAQLGAETGSGRARRYIIPGLIWFAAVALFIAVWIYVILQTDG